MATSSTPVTPRREAPDGALMLAHTDGALHHKTRLGLLEYKRRMNASNSDLARRLGFTMRNSAIVSAYLNAETDEDCRGDWMKLQSAAADLLAAAERKQETKALAIHDNAVTAQVFGLLELIRSTNDLALIHGRAGVGKTSAMRLYARRNTNTIAITATEWKKGQSGITNALMQAVGLALWDYRTPRGDWLEIQLKDSDRLIIVDNAQRLTQQAIRWLLDFHDVTGCPIAFFGNPEVLEKFTSDQAFSRIGICEAVDFPDAASRETFARQLLNDHAPDFTKTLTAEASCVLADGGKARTLVKQLKLAAKLRTAPEFRDLAPDAAFVAARGKLVTAQSAQARKGGK